MPADYYEKYLTNLASVDAQKVQDIAKSLINPAQMHIVIVGNAKQIAKGLEKYGPVKYFDLEGNEIAAPVEAKLDASLTPASLMDNSPGKEPEINSTESALSTVKSKEKSSPGCSMPRSVPVVQYASSVVCAILVFMVRR